MHGARSATFGTIPKTTNGYDGMVRESHEYRILRSLSQVARHSA